MDRPMARRSPPVSHLPPSPLAEPGYEGHGELELRQNTAGGLEGQAGRGTARPCVTCAPHHWHGSTTVAPFALSSVPGASSFAAGGHAGSKGRERLSPCPSLPAKVTFLLLPSRG